MKILLYTDNHYCQYSSIIRGRGSKYSLRLENQIQSLNWAERLAESEQCEQIVCLGDFFDKPELNAEELTALQDIEWSKIPHKFIVGNHEIASVDNSYNSLNALSAIGEVISEVETQEGFDYVIHYLPYILESNRKPLNEYVTRWGDKNNICLSHNDIAGISYGGWESKSGFSIEEIENNCEMFINGHLHNQAYITDTILNLGSLTGQNFSEDATTYKHTVGILDTSTLKITLIQNPYAFNLYKVSVKTREDISKLSNLLDNAVVAVTVDESLVEEVREILDNNKSNVGYKVTCSKGKESQSNTEYVFKKVDHIEMFRDYIFDTIGKTDVIEDELFKLI